MDARDLTEPARKRQNARLLYAHPLPLPRLPASLLTYIAGLILPSSLSDSAYIEHVPTGVYDELTGCVRVTDCEDMMVLWRRGFFGKGSLSRSEPTWLARESNSTLKLGTDLTAEELTAQRRIERRAAKIQKAKEKLAELSAIATPTEQAAELPDPLAALDEAAAIEIEAPPDPILADETIMPEEVLDDSPLINEEHLQLQREEAFFLLWATGSLRILDEETQQPLSIPQVWSLFLRPPFDPLDATPLRPDNPFLISYVVYHHFRSLGWVVRNGVKFCVDWVLYKGSDGSGRSGGVGPVGGHAEFAVLVYKHYEDPADRPPDEMTQLDEGNETRRDWRFITTVNRVCSGVKKTLLLVYVTVPSRKRCSSELIASGPQAVLQLYSVREIAIRRFVPTRLRD